MRPSDDAYAESLWREFLAPPGVKLILRTFGHISQGIAVRVPQDEALATWEPSFDRVPLYRPELPQIGGTEIRYEVETLHPAEASQ